MRDPADKRRALLELALLLFLAALAFATTELATDRWIERAAALGIEGTPAAAAVKGGGRRAALLFALGVLALAAGRVVGLRRARDPLPVPLLLPALVAACLLGLTVQAATVDLISGQVMAPSAGRFAGGFLLGAVGGAAVLVLPRDPAELAARMQPLLLGGIVLTFALLAFFGTGPGSSGTRINLGPLQPIEAVKPAFVVFLAVYLGRRAGKLRWQRARFAGLRWPRPVLFVPALVTLLLLFLALYLVRDLGPTLVLSLVFIALFYLATRASGFALVALLLLGATFSALALFPELAGGGTIGGRIAMWLDPWHNQLTHGHQLGESLWALAAGGLRGQGLAGAHVPGVPAAKTDLILATMTEQVGFAGLALYLALLALLALCGLYVAARSRTPERVLMAAGLSVLLIAQWAIIHAGTMGALPLTGIVAPFLSSGRSSMVAFVMAIALLVRLSEDGRARAPSAELDELRRGVAGLGAAGLLVLLAGAGLGLYRSVIEAPETSARGILVRLEDGTLRHRQNPRLVAMTRGLRRGAILDRRGEPLAKSSDATRPRARDYPLGSALGTLLGTPPGGGCLPWWSLERRLDTTLRGYPETDHPPAFRTGCHDREPIPSPDLRAFVPLLRLSREERSERLRELDAEIAARSVRLSLDARLQRGVYELLVAAVEDSPGEAAAAVVIDADTGQVLARAQVPDYDPGDRAWRARLAAREPAFVGAYGPLADKTGLRGIYQAGSVGKLVTALAAARRGWRFDGDACRVRAEPTYSCDERDEQGPSFTLPEWDRPIHDFPRDPTHGTLDVVRALAVSCNVYFGQLGLSLGPAPYRALVKDGVDIGPYDREGKTVIRPGRPGSRPLAETGFGQGGTWMNVLQAARLTAAIGAGGIYRRCSPTMELDAPCEELRILGEEAALRPILAGMRAVMEPGGTGARLEAPRGVRVYGKTGTADAPGFEGEEPYGFERGAAARPHSWFVALAEPSSASPCAPRAKDRLAVAVVVPRGGAGARVAGPVAMEILEVVSSLGYLGEGAR